MLHVTFGNTEFTTAILIKASSLNEARMRSEYLTAMEDAGLDSSKVVAFGVPYDKKKPSAACRKNYIESLIPELDRLGITQILVADGEYFKTLTKQTKADPHIGYVFPCAFAEHIQACYIVAYPNYFYNPENKDKTERSLKALYEHSQGTYEVLGTNVLKEVYYLSNYVDIASWLKKLLRCPALTVDIEAYSLKHYDAGIGTISFSWDEHSAVVFPVDTIACDPYEIEVWDKKDKKFKKKTALNIQHKNEPVRALLKAFFEAFKGTHVWHNASYDLYVLTYQLFMEDLLDRKGMLYGFKVLLKNFECSQIITYLATNSCAGNQLGLKAQAHEFVGNYALDVKDIRLLDVPSLLEYNAIDTCATWYVMDKNYLQMVEDEQLAIYRNIFKPCVIDILEMQLTGLCLDMVKVNYAKDRLSSIGSEAIKAILETEIAQRFIYEKRLQEVETRNAAYKKKQITLVDTKFVFNPNSTLQLQELLYEYMGLPIIDKTDSNQPASGGKTLKKLLNHTSNESFKLILTSLRDYAQTNKVLTSFITAFMGMSVPCPDGTQRIYGSFKLGGTVSARLSSSNINFQQIPSGSTFAKLIKACCVAPPKMIMAMSDFSALEDVINTLLTRDPAKEKVLLDHFDGHSFRCYSFWTEKFPHIDPTDPESVNTIAKTHEGDRSAAKPVHFAMQYLGTWVTLMNNCGFSQEESQLIEQRYHSMYKTSFEWIDERIREASVKGYGVGAFGLRIRAPLLHQVVVGNNKTPREAAAESRTLGNALSGQSYCLLNGRASMEFMQRVRASKYALKVHLWAHIHDAIYLYVEDCMETIEWVNTNLIECMQWQELPELQHERIHVSSELDLAYPSWKDAFTIPNGANQEEIYRLCKAEALKRKENQ